MKLRNPLGKKEAQKALSEPPFIMTAFGGGGQSLGKIYSWGSYSGKKSFGKSDLGFYAGL